MNEKDQDNELNKEEGNAEQLSGDEILDKIEKDASEHNHDEMKEGREEGNDLFKKLGFSKKDKLPKGHLAEKKENEELKQQLAELNDKYLRLFADFDNFRKRNLKERIELIKTAGIEVVSSLLPVLDDFQRALKQMEATEDPMTEGVKLIYQKLISILESKGLRAMDSIGEVFNPELHEAITEVPVQDESMKGRIADEIERGYYLSDKIIRHAKVVVGK
ncbi:MAG TPA: nucleotide exchange factor GrpE [Chitinophagales bacterium]|nr:nucleotide exchange factor GrpE [Chitinophagales bacterium]